MGVIRLNNIRTYAYHGCLSEEAKIGSAYRVDLWVEADLQTPAESDKLEDAIDYVKLNAIVKKEMAQRSNLLENVAKRIMDRIFKDLPQVTKTGVAVSKINPPIGGDVEHVSVELSQAR